MKNLNIHYFQHVPFEGTGCIENWAMQHSHTLTATKFHGDRPGTCLTCRKICKSKIWNAPRMFR